MKPLLDRRPPGPVAGAALALLLVGAGAAGCGERHHVEHRVWTLFDIQRALHEDGNVAMGPTLPDGLPASSILTKGDGYDLLQVTPAFSEGQPAAFVTTDLWINYDEVWVQPGFIQAGLKNADGTPAPVIFDVGPDSTFYSPFWNLKLAQVGDVEPDRYRSTRQLFDAKVPIEPAEPHACPLRPLDVLGQAPGQHPVEPTWQTQLDDFRQGQAWVDGTKMGLFDLGGSAYQIQERPGNGMTAVAVPAFIFLRPNASGAVEILAGARRVLGAGPLFSGATGVDVADPAAPYSQPKFGAFWRVHLALLPATAGVFLANEHPSVTPTGVDLKEYEGRVALTSTCFEDAGFPASCTWLDSQAKVELLGPNSITPTEIMGTCPFVFYNKKPVRL